MFLAITRDFQEVHLSQTFRQNNHELAFLSGGGEMAALISGFDWASTPLGPISVWPQSLRTTVSLMLRSQVPLVSLWGTEGIMIYNDAYSQFASRRHPKLLGSAVRIGWPEVADFNDNVMKVILAGGNLAYRDQELTLYRSGRPEQVWMNLDYSPALDEHGLPAGVIAIVVETTSRVLAEQWIIGERDRQRRMFEQAPGIVAMLSGRDHVFEVTNQAYRQLIGHRDVIGKTVRDALPDVEGQGFYELLDQVYESGEPFIGAELRAEIQRVPNAPKEERFLDLIYQPVHGQTGEILGIFVQGSDVTDRVVAEREVRANETRYRMFLEAMPNHVWTAPPNGELDWFNQRVYEYSGSKIGELDGNKWTKIVHPDDLERAVTEWQKAIVSGTSYETEFRLRLHDGTYRWHIARAVPIRRADGQLLQWVGTNTDIDEQKRISQALSESERRLKLSQNAAGISALELDIATGTVIGSEGFWDLWGLSKRDSVQIGVLEKIVIPEDKDVRSNHETRNDGTAAPNVEYRIIRPDNGQHRWLSRHVDFVRNDSGKPIKMFGVMQDITVRKEAEARQQMLTHELEHRTKNILATVASISTQTLKGEALKTVRETLLERLIALSKAHDLLNNTRWTNASIAEVIEKTVTPLPPEQLLISGPPLSINPRMALSLALAVNELGTNAQKYGALSTLGGKVSISWALEPSLKGQSSELVWRWNETGGPAVVQPTRVGFGSFLIKRVLATDFEGSVEVQYHQEGVECILRAPYALPLQDFED